MMELWQSSGVHSWDWDTFYPGHWTFGHRLGTGGAKTRPQPQWDGTEEIDTSNRFHN